MTVVSSVIFSLLLLLISLDSDPDAFGIFSSVSIGNEVSLASCFLFVANADGLGTFDAAEFNCFDSLFSF